MGARGPVPGANPNSKPSDQRRRRNKPELFEELPAEGYQGEYPELPRVYDVEIRHDENDEPYEVEVEYRSETREWYEDWARSPMATKFTKTDWNRLRWVVAPLFDRNIRNPGDTKTAGELRLQEEKLGATVMDRQRLRQVIAEDSKEPEKQKVADVRRLRAVDPKAA